MLEPACCSEVRLRLARHGLPAERIDRVAHELAEHWEDLRAAALDRNGSAAEADASANERLGHPERLATEVISGLRRSSWLGRHPIAGICLVPLLLAPLLMGAVVVPLWWLDLWIHFTHWGAAAGQRNEHLIVAVLLGLYYAASIGASTWICSRTWRAGLGLRWVLAMCAWSAFASFVRFFHADAAKRQISAGFTFSSRLNDPAIGMLLFHGLLAAGFFLTARHLTRKAQTIIENNPSDVI
jgi:hypothetical protein